MNILNLGFKSWQSYCSFALRASRPITTKSEGFRYWPEVLQQNVLKLIFYAFCLSNMFSSLIRNKISLSKVTPCLIYPLLFCFQSLAFDAFQTIYSSYKARQGSLDSLVSCVRSCFNPYHGLKWLFSDFVSSYTVF
jgi:cellulose synthase/poly-beta-1,6-N-acetylglucosamine synthase-like glycosyltransferase